MLTFSTIAILLSQSAFATANSTYSVIESDNNISKDGYALASESEYKENGYIITDKISIKEAEVSPRGKSGSRTVRYEKDIAADSRDKELLYTFYISRLFKWNPDNNTATVSNVTKGYTSYISGTYPKVESSKEESASNQRST